MKLISLVVFAIYILVAYCVEWDPQNLQTMSASDQHITEWEAQGRPFWCAMRGSDRAAGVQLGDRRNPPSAESVFQSGKAPLDDQWSQWFWHESDKFNILWYDFNLLGLGDPLRTFEAYGRENEDWRWSRLQHEDPTSNTKVSEQTYTTGRRPIAPGVPATYFRKQRYATGAYYDFAVHRKLGLLIFFAAVPPRRAAAKNWPNRGPQGPIQESELPQLQHPSDILFMGFRHRRGSHTEKLMKVFFPFIVSDKTVAIIAKELLNRGLQDLEPWPAAQSVVQIDSPAGRALLTTSEGLTAAMLLIRHKEHLGRMHIRSFHFYKGPHFQGRYRPSLIIEFENVPQHLILTDVPAIPDPPYRDMFPAAKREEFKETHSRGQGDREIITEHMVHF